jgi:hypothetical protein
LTTLIDRAYSLDMTNKMNQEHGEPFEPEVDFDAQAEDEQAHWEEDPEYQALYLSPAEVEQVENALDEPEPYPGWEADMDYDLGMSEFWDKDPSPYDGDYSEM